MMAWEPRDPEDVRRGEHFVKWSLITVALVLVLIVVATKIALASAPPQRPDPARVTGCTVTLPNAPGDRDAVLVVRTTRPLSDCDESAPVAFGASVRDGAGGRR